MHLLDILRLACLCVWSNPNNTHPFVPCNTMATSQALDTLASELGYSSEQLMAALKNNQDLAFEVIPRSRGLFASRAH
jgi:hypothetical protein